MTSVQDTPYDIGQRIERQQGFELAAHDGPFWPDDLDDNHPLEKPARHPGIGEIVGPAVGPEIVGAAEIVHVKFRREAGVDQVAHHNLPMLLVESQPQLLGEASPSAGFRTNAYGQPRTIDNEPLAGAVQ